MEGTVPSPRASPSMDAPADRDRKGPALDETFHELRVRIPHDQHRQLLSLKVLRGMSLAETVSTALAIYFAERARQMAEGRDPDAANA